MKLLYVWIERFRNIRRQGFVVDNEWLIDISNPEQESVVYVDRENPDVHVQNSDGSQPKFARTIYFRKINFRKNGTYSSTGQTPICSISALVGPNAAGKTSIIECLHAPADQFGRDNPEHRYFFMAFYDVKRNCIVIKSRDIWLPEFEKWKITSDNKRGYEEYVIPIDSRAGCMDVKNDPSLIISIYQQHRESTAWSQLTMGIPVLPFNLSRKDVRNSFPGAFQFLSDFPELGGKDSHLVFYLHDKDAQNDVDYFEKEKDAPQKYKNLFIYKFSNLAFNTLRDFLYHEPPQFVMSGERIKRPEEAQLRKEDDECAEILSFCSLEFPQRKHDTLIAFSSWDIIPQKGIAAALSFFRKSTYVYNCKPIYDHYLNALEAVFHILYDTPDELFTALYKLDIPFEGKYRSLVDRFNDLIEADGLDQDWCDYIRADFEWLSAGEYQMAMMFSGVYQRITDSYKYDEMHDTILMLDEPETHMHPETGRHFIKNLEKVISAFEGKGYIDHCQIILSTHSPFLIQELKGYNSTISLVRQENRSIFIANFNDLTRLMFPNRTTYSFNLVMYHIFGVPTVELHIELYGYLQNKIGADSINKCDKYIATHPLFIAEKHKKIYNYQNKTYQALPTYIRNCIDHPSEEHCYTSQELQTSIDFLIQLCNEESKSDA